jgi:hypothetical protein
MKRRRGSRADGVVLLEVLVALTILATAGIAAVAFADGALRNAARATERDTEVRAASDRLNAIALWSRADLDRQLGARPHGVWRVIVDRSRESIYDVSVVDTTTGDTLVTTSLYRPPRREVRDAP